MTLVLSVLLIATVALAMGVSGSATGGCEAVVAEGESIQDAIDAAEAGDTVCVESGTFNESLQIHKPLTLTAKDGHEPVLDAERTKHTAINVTSTSNVVVDGLEIRDYTHKGIDVGYSEDVVVRNTDFRDFYNAIGLNVHHSSDVLVESNTVRDSSFMESIRFNRTVESNVFNNEIYDVDTGAGAGITLLVSHDNVVSNNNITDGRNGVRLSGSSRVLVENNTIHDTGSGSAVGIGSNHHLGDPPATDNVVRNNELVNPGGAAVRLHQAPNTTIESNEIRGEGRSDVGIRVNYGVGGSQILENNVTGTDGGMELQSSNGLSIVENTIEDNNGAGITVANASALTIERNEIHDNVERLSTTSIGISFIDQIDSTVGADEGPVVDPFVRNNTVSGHGIDLDLYMATGAVVEGNEFETGAMLRATDAAYTDHEFSDNTVGGERVQYVYGEDNPAIDEDAGQVIVASSTDVTVRNTSHEGVSTGVQIAFSDDVTIHNVTSVNGSNAYVHDSIRTARWHGGSITLVDSDGGTISNTTTIGSGQVGIAVHESDHVRLANNTASDNAFAGVRMLASNESVITGNILVGSGEYDGPGSDDGFGLYTEVSNDGPGATIANNTLTDNEVGLEMDARRGDLHDWTVVDNQIQGNDDGITVESDVYNVEIRDNHIQNNDGDGLYYSQFSDTELNATMNWWGDPSGPDSFRGNLEDPNTGEKADGDGDRISHRDAPIRFDPWLESDPIGYGPIATFVHHPDDPDMNEVVTFDASDSSSRLHEIAEYRWDFTGDGSFDETTSDPETTWTYDETGTYEVTLEVEDDASETAETTETITVSEPDEAEANIEVINASLSETDIDEGDEVTISATLENTGDATGTHTAALEIDDAVEDDETVEVAPGETEEIAFTHTFDDAGEFDVRVDDVEAGTVTVSEVDEPSPSPSPSPSPTLEPDPEPDPEPVVSFEPIANGTAVSVTDAVANETVSIPLADELEGADPHLAWLNVTAAVDGDYEARIETSDELPADVTELPADPTLLDPLQITTSLESDEIENATFEFGVSADELGDRGLEPEDVTLYHYDDGEWTERETEVAFPGGTWDVEEIGDSEVVFPGGTWDVEELNDLEERFPGGTWEVAKIDDTEVLYPGDMWNVEEVGGDAVLFPGGTWDVGEVDDVEERFPGGTWEVAEIGDTEVLFPGGTWDVDETVTDEELFPGGTWEVAEIGDTEVLFPGGTWDVEEIGDVAVMFPGGTWDLEDSDVEDLNDLEERFPGGTWEVEEIDDTEVLYPGGMWDVEVIDDRVVLFPGGTWDVEEVGDAGVLYPGGMWDVEMVDDRTVFFPGGTWEETETAGDRFPGGTWDVTYRAETPHFSTFALVGDRPNLEVVDTAVSTTEFEVGEELIVKATVRNDGGAAGESDVTLEVDGTVQETETVSVPSEKVRELTFTWSVDEPGTYEVRIDGKPGADVTVLDPGEEKSDESDGVDDSSDDSDDADVAFDDDTDRNGDDAVPGFGALAAIVAVLALAMSRVRR